MLRLFRDDLWAMSRERKGYYSWAQRERWALFRAMGRKRYRPCHCFENLEPRDLVDMILESGPGIHPAIDSVFHALVRAESRLSLRFVPQRSHEERLTGNLVSEMEAALHLLKPHFSEVCEQRYGEQHTVDFFYYDLSQGGTIEKETGADLGFILLVELPDLPPVVRYVAFQAKKIHGSSQLPKVQYDALCGAFGDAAHYLFYDMDLSTLMPPMVLSAAEIKSIRDQEEGTQSFAVSLDRVDDGLPLSLWLLTQLAASKVGMEAASFEDAFYRFTRAKNHDLAAQGRLAVLSVGKPIRVSRDQEIGLRVTV